MKTNSTVFIAQFLPLFLFYLFFAYPDEMLQISITPLGRLIAILIIIFYTNLHMMYGLMICILVIFYYQMDLVEGMSDYSIQSNHHMKIDHKKNINDKISTKVKNKIKKHDKSDGWDIFDWISPPPNEHHIDHHIDNHIDNHLDHHLDNHNDNDAVEGFTQLNDNSQNEFQQQNCKDGQLMYKNNEIKTENADFVFPEIHFKQGSCNPCDVNCEYSIVQKKISVQEDLTYPKMSDDWTTKIWNTWFSEDHSKPYASTGVSSSQFSLLG